MIALSPDKPEELAKTLKEESLSYMLVCDHEMTAAEAFGISFQVDAPGLSD